MVTSPTHQTQPSWCTYRIRVAGALDEDWSARTHGMTISVHSTELARCFTELTGQLPDQAALMGVLDALYSHGARLLRVEQVDEDELQVIKPIDSRGSTKESTLS